jgi:hypothetical protein
VIDTDQACHFDMSGDLLQAFASRRVPRIFVVVDEAAGKAPQTTARFDRAPSQDDAAVYLDHHRRGDLGIVPKHEVVVDARFYFAAFDHARHQLGAAIDAVVGHESNSSSPRSWSY